MTHTQGPWRAQYNGGDQTWTLVGTVGNGIPKIADVYPGITEANARLIAAAPELLDALRETVEELDMARNGSVWLTAAAEVSARARAAIEKATGQEVSR